jgi:hypothetical protein
MFAWMKRKISFMRACRRQGESTSATVKTCCLSFTWTVTCFLSAEASIMTSATLRWT